MKHLNVTGPVEPLKGNYDKLYLPTAGYEDFDFTTTPSVPCTREAMLMAMYGKGSFCMFDRTLSSNNYATAEELYDTISKAEWFDFGRVDADDLAASGYDANPFMLEGLLRAPYERCVFRTRIICRETANEVEMLIVVQDELKSPGLYRTTVLALRTNGPRNEYLSLMSAVVLEGNDIRRVGSDVVKDGSLTTYFEYAGLWTILNTRGIKKEVVEPDAKLNRARVKSGKEPLRRLTRIDSKQYITALRETERMESHGKGDRRSPKMHLRRGHVRTFSDERYKGLRGKRRWIRPMIVGGDTNRIANRDRYEVKR